MYKFLKTNSEKDKIRKLLIDFYKHRPESYGLNDESLNCYEKYIKLVQKYSNRKKRLLDFGTGNHQNILALAYAGFNVFGLDILSDLKYSEIKSNLFGINASIVNYNGSQSLPFENNTFEVISSNCVFEHLIDVISILEEFKRILKPKGKIIIICPNWGGINNPIRALYVMRKKKRYFHFKNYVDLIIGLIFSIYYPFYVKISQKQKFIYIYPMMKNNKINFEIADDDAVHLCIPTSFKEWFKKNGFKILSYNKDAGNSKFSRIFNKFFPMYSTENVIIAELK